MISRGSNTKASILYAFECGEYGHRIELCPKQNQTDVENSPAAKEVLPNPDPQVGSEQRPFEPWNLPTDVEDRQPKNRGPIANTQKEKEGQPNPERSYGSGSQKRDACARVRNQPYFSLVERRHSVLAGVLSRIRSLIIGLLPKAEEDSRTPDGSVDLP